MKKLGHDFLIMLLLLLLSAFAVPFILLDFIIDSLKDREDFEKYEKY